MLYILELKKGEDSARGKMLAMVTALLALGLPIYTGYDLSVHQSRPVWNTPVMAVLVVALAIASGSALGSLLSGGNAESQKVLREYMLWSTAGVGVILVSILGTTSYGGSSQELTFMILTTGTMGMIFVGVRILAGTAAPVAMLFLAHLKQQTGGLVSAALLILAGSTQRRQTGFGS